ncbi:MAG: HAD hydrolase family protein [Ilumatobacteraceae bacterium]|nr:HAD hydrolase family protein [Acidimicrobiaceae bacterium]
MTGNPMVVALDVDGTLYDGRAVAAEAVAAIAAAAAAGHVVLIVTGRPWRDLPQIIPDVLPHVTLAACEEGTVMVRVATGEHLLLAEPVNRRFATGLVAADVGPVSLGDVMIGAPALAADVARRLRDEGDDDVHLVRNKGSVAILPSGFDKGRALRDALRLLGLEGSRVLAIGDAANDLPMFAVADVAVAVAGADAAVRDACIPLTEHDAGVGVAEALRRHLPVEPSQSPS